MKTILILGSSGCLGNALKNVFSAQGYNILNPSSKELNLLDYNTVNNYFYTFKNSIDYVIHAAGFVGGLYHNLTPNEDFFVKNYAMGCNVVNAMIFNSIKAKILYFGSSCMYRADLTPPYKEENLFDKIEESQDNWRYAKAKQAISELILHYKIGSVVIPPNLYGVRRLKDAEDINNKHLLETVAYKYSLTKAVNFKCSKDIRREILSVKELARVCVKYLDLLLENSIAINIGTGYSVSMQDIADKLLNAEISFDDKAYSSLKDKFMDTSKFQQLTGDKLYCFTDFNEYINKPFTLN